MFMNYETYTLYIWMAYGVSFLGIMCLLGISLYQNRRARLLMQQFSSLQRYSISRKP